MFESMLKDQEGFRIDILMREANQVIDKANSSMRELTTSMEKITKSSAEMDKMTQQTAANAGASASSSQQMNAQARQMKNVVGKLVATVSGNGKNWYTGKGSCGKQESIFY